jgi:hypothetical protein
MLDGFQQGRACGGLYGTDDRKALIAADVLK